MPWLALVMVLLAAGTHAVWNLAAKRAADCQHFVWMYSALTVVLYAPLIVWLVSATTTDFQPRHWLALAASAVLHAGYSLMLQAGYRASDLSLVYPLARGSGPLLSFMLAIALFDETFTAIAGLGVLLVVTGIVLVSGLLQGTHRAPAAGLFFGIGTGAFTAAYTLNDGWAVKVLAISPFFVDYAGNLLRTLLLSPRAWLDRAQLHGELRAHGRSALIVSLLGPAGYILVLFAMQLAPISRVAPARELSTLIGAYLGARVLGEKLTPARLVGAVCIVSGVIGLAFSDAG